MTPQRRPTHWCANFDGTDVLEHGLEVHAWLLQYQYEHGGFDYQGSRRQKGRTTAVWNSVLEVEIGDWLMAYLSGGCFFAVGRVVEPKRREWQAGAIQHWDTVKRTVRAHSHLYFDGVVRYCDSPTFYEDFADPWSVSTEGMLGHQPNNWPYAQRIDVAEWEHVVADGVCVSGLATAAPLPLYRRPLFRVEANFFAEVLGRLQGAAAVV